MPVRDSRQLWESLTLDCFQAGLSWITILRKRENFRRAFEGFNPIRIARYGEAETCRLLEDAGIVRHRGKIEAAIQGARAWLRIEEREGFAKFLWRFVDGRPIQNRFRHLRDVPAFSPESESLSRALRAEGFRFVGPTCVYAFMQGSGLVNDHLVDCHRYVAVQGMGSG